MTIIERTRACLRLSASTHRTVNLGLPTITVNRYFPWLTFKCCREVPPRMQSLTIDCQHYGVCPHARPRPPGALAPSVAAGQGCNGHGAPGGASLYCSVLDLLG